MADEAKARGLADAQASAFMGQEMWTKLASDPSTRGFLQQPDFVNMMQEVHKNPRDLNLYLKDQRVRQSLTVLFNFKLRPEPAVDKKREPELTEEKAKKKLRAKREKELGTAAFKKRGLETAIQHYSTAMEIDDQDISYLTNRAAVYLAMGKYKECIEDCDKAVERGRELGSDNKMVARAWTRKGTSLTKIAKCSKDYEPAIEAFQIAHAELLNSELITKLNEAKRAKKEWEEKEYIDPKMGDEELQKGNEFFREQKYPEAIKHYTEAMKRKPNDPTAYSNRAACYIKLGAMPDGLKDAKECIKVDPTFSKGYIRKAAVEIFIKEYDNAMKTFQEGLKHDPSNQQLLFGGRRCVQQINKINKTESKMAKE